MNRVLVVGTTGSGKTTVATAIARAINAPHIEMDGLFWKPNWTESDHDEFRERVEAAIAPARWVADADYVPRIGDAVWERADTVVWLDLPTAVIVARLARRTISRSLRKTELWGGNRETLGRLWDKNLVTWAAHIQHDTRAMYEARMADPKWADVAFVRLRSRRAVRAWIAELEDSVRR